MPKKKQNTHNLRYYQKPDKYGDWLGYKVESIDTKKYLAKTSIVLRDDHLSPAGKIHGGVISGFLDFSCGAAVFSTMGPEDFCSTVELKVNYLRPLDPGDKLQAFTEVQFRGKKLCVVLSKLYRKQELVALATSTFNIVSKS